MKVGFEEQNIFRLIFLIEYGEAFSDSPKFFKILGVGLRVSDFLIDVENSLE